MYRTTLLACGFAALTLAQICDPKLKAKEDRPTDLRCGQRGTLSNSKAEQRYLISYVSDNTLDGCAKYCLGSEGCNFFTLDTKKNYYSQCHIYKRTGRVMGAVGNASSPLHLYNIECFDTSCPPVVPATCSPKKKYNPPGYPVRNFTSYFSGRGVDVAPRYPGIEPEGGFVSSTSENECDAAAAQCAYDTSQYGYTAFSLTWRQGTGWDCTEYDGEVPPESGSYTEYADSSVGNSYGFSAPCPSENC